jgi:hypothetical protein
MMVNDLSLTGAGDETFTLIRVKVSTKERLKTACPRGMQFQFFATEFIENALDHRDILEQVAGGVGA